MIVWCNSFWRWCWITLWNNWDCHRWYPKQVVCLIQVVYLNRSHSLLLNRLLLYVFHLFYTYFFDDMVAISFRIYDDRPRDRVSYSWRMMLIISTSLTSSLRLGKWRAWHWPLLWKFWSSAEYYCISTILVLIIASCHHYVMWSTYMITSYEDFTSSFIRKLLNR